MHEYKENWRLQCTHTKNTLDGESAHVRRKTDRKLHCWVLYYTVEHNGKISLTQGKQNEEHRYSHTVCLTSTIEGLGG